MTKNQIQTKQQRFFSLNKKRLFLIVLFCLVFVLAFCSTENVSTAEGKEWFKIMTDEERAKEIEEATGGGMVGSALKAAGEATLEGGLKLLLRVAAWTLATAVKTLNFMLDGRIYEQVFFSESVRGAINTGWGLVRDFVNMFYVLILLFLAIATILRVNKFSDKKLLFTVVLSALLINFSQPITIVVVDASNLAMNFFAKQITSTGTSFATTLTDKVKLSEAGVKNVFGAQGAYVATFAEIIFTTVLAITILVLALALIIRLVAFWVLIVLSPLAFFGLTLPGTALSSLWSGWLSKLTNYAFFGPILLFFLWLALILIDALSFSKLQSSISGINDPIAAGSGIDTVAINMLKETIPFVAAIYLLFYGYSLSRDMAAKAGSMAGSLFNKGQGWMNKGAKYAAVAGVTGAGAGYLAYKMGGKQLVSDRIAATKNRLNDTTYGKYLTKEGRKKASEERIERWSGKGDDQNRRKMNEQLKDWKDKGDPSADEQARIDARGSQVERMALAMHRAEKGKFKNADDFEKAMSTMGADKISAGRLRSLAEKKNLNAVMGSDIRNAENALSSGNDTVIDKAIAENAALQDVIKLEEGRIGAEMTDSQKRAHIRASYLTHDLERKAYQGKLNSTSLSSMAEQDISFFRNKNVTDALKIQRVKMTPAEERKKQQEMRTFANRDKNMTPAKEQALKDAELI